MCQTVWIVTSLAAEEGGWLLLGVFSSRHGALKYAASAPYQTFVQEREVDGEHHWGDTPHISKGEGIDPVSRADLLAEGLDFVVTA